MKRLLAVLAGLMILVGAARADGVTVYVTATKLNGRDTASLKGRKECLFLNGDALTAVSYKTGWVEVVGGESGTVWCKAEYLAENTGSTDYVNTSGARARVHGQFSGGNDDYVRWVENGESVTVNGVLLGWGYVGDGWIDLSCFSEVAE